MLDIRLSRTSSLPLHIQLLDELRHRIMTGVLRPDDRLPGEWELVKALDISRATIQKAWQVAEDEKLIYRIAGKGTFVAKLATETTDDRHLIGFFIPEYRGAFAVQMLSGAEQVLRRQGYRIQIASTDRNINEENRLLYKLMEDGASGCILVPVRGEVTGRALASGNINMPVVLMDRPINGLMLPCISSNNYVGGLQAMNHLIDLGHKRIGFVARPHLDLWSVSERYRAYQDALNRIGVTPAPPILIGADGKGEMSSYEAYLSESDDEIQTLISVLRRPDRPTAIFAVNDWIAIKVQQAMAQLGLRNPEDLSIIGFDDTDIAKYQTPPLTTIAQNPTQMGIEAARRLITLVEGEPNQAILTLLPTELVVRQSTATPSQ